MDAKAACDAIESFTSGLDIEGFAASALIRSAVERQFEIIGEALSKASKEDDNVARLLPDVPRIVGLRNRLIHGYDNVDDQLIWDIVRTKLPALRNALAMQLMLPKA
ncbi:MAG TPA: HepT-like ribonuclease domain-containing protein [Opitutaceae bacterium]|nr:HepT-like ribonuclease domain-containing protein [Opitutaceae bacterium]